MSVLDTLRSRGARLFVSVAAALALLAPQFAVPQFVINPYAFGSADPYFSNVTVLMPFQGNNGDTTTTDIKGNTVTRNGTPTLSSTQAKYGTTSGSFNGSQSYSVAAGAGLQMGSGDFTIETWIYPTSLASGLDFLNTYVSTAGAGFVIQLNSSAGAIAFIVYHSSGSFVSAASGAGAITVNAWNFVAACREGTTTRLYTGTSTATQAATGNISTNSMNASTQPLFIGAEGSSGTSSGAAGFQQYVRVTKGVCRYPGGTSFAVPAAFPTS